MTVDFLQPPVTRTSAGTERRFGFELEFAGVTIDAAAGLVARQFGGTPVAESPFVHRVRDTRVGEFTVEIDAEILKNRVYRRHLRELGIELDNTSLGQSLDELIRRVAATVVPCEIITPPMGLDELKQIDALREQLRLHHAQGTSDSLLYAFGLHINAEAPELTSESMLRHLRAFLLLYDGLFTESKIDLSRRITPFIQPFPAAYRNLVLQADYRPSRDRLIDDYLEYNPSRDRPLDMLPLFAWVDADRVGRQAEHAGSVSQRPAYHYRLPNCQVGQPDWRVATEWNRWVRVECLAADTRRMGDMLSFHC